MGSPVIPSSTPANSTQLMTRRKGNDPGRKNRSKASKLMDHKRAKGDWLPTVPSLACQSVFRNSPNNLLEQPPRVLLLHRSMRKESFPHAPDG